MAGGGIRGGVILDRGNGVIDAIVHCQDTNSDIQLRKSVLARTADPAWLQLPEPGTGRDPVLHVRGFRDQFDGSEHGGLLPGASGAPALLPYARFDDRDLRLKTAPAVQTSDGRPSYAPSAARFGPTETWLWTGGTGTSGFTPPADSKQFTFCFAIKLTDATIPADDQTLLRLQTSGGAIRFQIIIRGTTSGTPGRIGLGRVSGGASAFINVTSTVAIDTNWHTVVVSVDSALAFASGVRFYIDRVNVRPTSATAYNQTDTIAFSECVGALFGREGAGAKPLIEAEVADFGFLAGAYFDLSDTKVLDRFVTPANELQNPRVDGRAMFLKKAQIFFSGNAANFVVNRGNAGAFTVGGGTVTDAATAPAGHP